MLKYKKIPKPKKVPNSNLWRLLNRWIRCSRLAPSLNRTFSKMVPITSSSNLNWEFRTSHIRLRRWVCNMSKRSLNFRPLYRFNRCKKLFKLNSRFNNRHLNPRWDNYCPLKPPSKHCNRNRFGRLSRFRPSQNSSCSLMVQLACKEAN